MLPRSRRVSGTLSHNIGDSVYYSLRKNIVTLNLEPGALLNVKNISSQLNVSRTPVRDALIKLEKEGLVDVIPQKGTSVSKIDLTRVEEERFLRQSLEVKAVGLFMQECILSHIEALKNNLHQQEECVTAKDYLTFLELDDAFHHVFFDVIEKNLCWETIQSISGHYRRVRLMSLWDLDVFKNVIDQHRMMVENISCGNVSQVLDLFIEHSTKIVKEEKALLQKYPAYFKEPAVDNFLVKDFLRLKG